MDGVQLPQGMDKRMSFIIFDLKKVKMNIHWKNKTKFFKRDSFRKRLFKHYCAWNQKMKRNEILKKNDNKSNGKLFKLRV